MNSSQERVWKIAATVGVLLTVFLAVLSIKELKSISYVGKSDQIINTISVNGKGEEISVPDVATFSFGVTETAKTVADAQTKSADRINAALKAVRDAGVKDKDVQTTSYTINPHYEYQNGVCSSNGACQPGKSVLTGYEVSQTIQVKVRDLAKAGTLFGSIGALGVQNVNGLSFSVDTIDAVKAKARAKAIADAQAKAETLADQLGVKIVRITGFYDQTDNTPYLYGRGGDMVMSAKAEAAPMAAPEVPAGEQKVISNITITYEIR